MTQTTDSDRLVSRRKYLLGASTLAGGVGLFTLTSDRTKAEVSMDTLNVQGADATMSNPPSSVTLSVAGSWRIDGTPPEQTRVVMQVENNSDARDMAELLEMDSPGAGDYALQAELLDHPEMNGADLLPAEVGKTHSTEIVVRIILLAIQNSQIQAETVVEDALDIVLTKDGMLLSVGGSGSVEVTA